MVNGPSRMDLSSIRVLWDVGTLAGLHDGELLTRFVDGDDETRELAFEVLVRRHGSMVLRVAEQLLVDRHAAEDAFQAVFLVLARKARSIRRPEQLGPWLYGVALRTAKEARKQASQRRRLERREATMLPANSTATDNLLVSREEAEALHGEIARLPEHYRGVVVLCDLEGLTQQEAATRLRCPLGTVAIRLKRARERLRDRLSRRGIGSSNSLALLATPRSAIEQALPANLIESTVRASVATGVASASVVSLAEGVQWTMTFAKWKTATAGAVLTLGLASAWVASGGFPGAQEGAPKTGVVEVEVVQPISREIVDFGEFVGQAEPSRVRELRASVGGILEKVTFPEGRRVKEGELLFEIDPKPHVAEFEVAAARVLAGEAQVRLASSVVARNKALQSKNVNLVSTEDIDRATAELEVARATLSVAVAVRDQAKIKLHLTRITAPFAGVVEPALVHPGDSIKAGETPLSKLVVIDPIAIAFNIDETTLLRLRRQSRGKMVNGVVELSVQVTLPSDPQFSRPGTVRFGGEPIDPATGTARLQAALPNADNELLVGMFVRVRLATSPPYQALLVPEAAIATQTKEKLVYVLDDHGIVEARPVTLGAIHENLRVIKEGLKSGDRVVISNLQKVKPGRPAKALPPPLPPPSPEKK